VLNRTDQLQQLAEGIIGPFPARGRPVSLTTERLLWRAIFAAVFPCVSHCINPCVAEKLLSCNTIRPKPFAQAKFLESFANLSPT
ncbi:hypothetical protein, partial [Accumulibacter sp.]|uniref:hypothetical protein n=1 Tax=Accumulibacter sp. TaxID=2053492 RepID=UPI0035B2C9D5